MSEDNEDLESNVLIELIKVHPDAVLPTKGHDDDNCWDLTAVEDVVIPARGSAIVNVGLKLGYITRGYGFAIKPRSGLNFKHGIQPAMGEIDNGYRGDLGIKLYNLTDTDYQVKKFDRIAQFKVEKVYPTTVRFTERVAESTRGESGFGSTGR